MLLKFSALHDISKWADCNVLFLMGQHNLFLSIAEKEASKLLGGSGLEYLASYAVSNGDGLLDEFDTADGVDGALSFRDFLDVCQTPAMYRRWHCRLRYEFMGKRDRNLLMEYLKNTSQNGLLVVTVTDYKDIRELKRSLLIKNAKGVYAVDLNYPYRDMLEDIVHDLFMEYGYDLSKESCRLFTMKVGVEYDDYKETVQQVAQRLDASGADKSKKVSYNDMKSASAGIRNFMLDDLVRALMKPSRTAKVVKSRKVYRVINVLLSDMDAKEICYKLKKRIYTMMQYRMHINNGCIPVRTRYNSEVVKARIDDSYKIKKASAISFKRNAYLASMTSMEDWMYMYTALASVVDRASEEECMKALLSVVNRKMFCPDRLMNALKVKDTLSEGLYDLNSVLYSDWWRSLKRVKEEEG